MYVPNHFAEVDFEAMRKLIAAHPLATLVMHTNAGLVANHLPIVLVAPNVLIGHVALGNELPDLAEQGQDALAIFNGENSYVSPNWYPSKRQHHRHVPTWNYLVIHVYGKISFQFDDKSKRAAVGQLTKFMETSTNGADGWRMSDAPKEYMRDMLDGIVAFKIEVHRLVGKSKLSQNRDAADFDNVALHMKKLNKTGMAQAMQEIADKRNK